MKKTKPETPNKGITNPEQLICISCGFCCEATLFDNATVKPGEKGTLPKKIEDKYFFNDSGEFFHLPCPYFDGKCSIYNQLKPKICSSFRCQLLKDFSSGRVHLEDAFLLIDQAKKQWKEIRTSAQNLLGAEASEMPFRKLLHHLYDLMKALPEEAQGNNGLKILAVKCNILEALHIRHFKSEKDFNSMKVPTQNPDPK